jgi:hypothetical protein
VNVAGRRNPPVDPQPIDRIHKAYRESTTDLAETLGWDVNTLACWFEQFQLIRMKEQGWPRNLAAWMAERDLRAFFYKPGETGD